MLTEQWGYTSPQMAADLLAASIACESISVLDAGCGTGLVGPCLKNLGAGEIIGIDYSLENKRFSDLVLPFTSRDLRKIYEDKLKQMSIKETRKSNDVFFKDKL